MPRSLEVLMCALSLAAGCPSSPAPVDSRPGDSSSSEHAISDLTRPAEARIDLRPDGPRPPAVWKSIPGAPKLEHHAIALLPGGDLLVAGGADTSSGTWVALAKAYRYALAGNSFADAGQLAEARHQHSATALGDGRVLIAGGETAAGTRLKSAELYDPGKPAAAAWSQAAAMMGTTTDHAAVRLKDGTVLVTGGRAASGDSQTAVQIYEPAGNLWKVTADPLKEPRRCHTMTVLKNGKILIAGGVKGTHPDQVWIPSLEIYDPASATTKLLASTMQMGRCGHTASLLDDGRVLLAGGYCGDKACPKVFVDDLYDPSIDQTSPVAHPGEFPSAHVAATLLDGRVLVAGGTDATDVAVYFEPPKSAWASAPSLLQGRWGARAERLLDGSVLVVGGVVSNTPTYVYADTAERYIP